MQRLHCKHLFCTQRRPAMYKSKWLGTAYLEAKSHNTESIKMLVVPSNKAGPFLPPCFAQSFPGSRLWLCKSTQLVVGLQTLMWTSVMLPGPALPKMSQGRGLTGLKGQTLLLQVSQYETWSVQTDLSQNRIVNKYGNTEQT